ncbi:MAG: sugar ABC transporter substrate-binding protein [Proteobacteria bacterium]|nr:MAG: sugar ABC transporter substrate-binding protein [Pseudomonadota bacterium]
MTMGVLKKSLLASVLAVGLVTTTQAAEVEVLHWWTSGGEAKALGVLKENLEKQGIKWIDMPVAGGGGNNAMTVLRSRVQAGNAPTAVQMLGFDIRDWASEGVTANLNALAEAENWAELVPSAVQDFSRYEGDWVAAPVNIHSTNWVWANKKIMDGLGVTEPPKDWDEFIAVLDKAKKAGYTPLAHGGQAWQDATVFEGIVLATGGADFYRKAFMDLDPDALGSDTMKTAFERLRQLRGYVDENFSGRDWNLASAMVIEGKAALQIMGDWAKGEFINAGLKPNEAFLCFRFPGTQGAVPFNTDQFVMFKVPDASRDAQLAMAKAVMDPSFQIAFNKVKGSVPARMGSDDAEFDACAQKGMKDVAEAAKNDTLLGSMAHGYGAPAAVKNAVFDVVTNFFNSETSTEDAVQQLVDAVEGAKD